MPGQVNLTILLAAAFSADLGLSDFQPLTHVMTPHVAIRLHQVCSSQRVYLKREPGPARVVGRPRGSPFLSILVPKKSSKVFRRGLKMSMSHFCRAWWARWGLGSLAGGKRYHFSPGYTT